MEITVPKACFYSWLNSCEVQIKTYLRKWLEIGLSLAKIKDQKLAKLCKSKPNRRPEAKQKGFRSRGGGKLYASATTTFGEVILMWRTRGNPPTTMSFQMDITFLKVWNRQNDEFNLTQLNHQPNKQSLINLNMADFLNPQRLQKHGEVCEEDAQQLTLNRLGMATTNDNRDINRQAWPKLQFHIQFGKHTLLFWCEPSNCK